MQVIETSYREVEPLPGEWSVTLGTFDGVHRGHAAICRTAVAIARGRKQAGAIALTFGRHPRAVLRPGRPPRLLTTLAEKIPLLAATGLDRLYVLTFDEELRQIDYRRFVDDLLVRRLGMRDLVLGHDVHFGRDREGTAERVEALARSGGFRFHQVESVREGEKAISSTWIRDLVEQGRLQEASVLLGHPYWIHGRVRRGRGLGRQLGVPTANLAWPEPAKLLPPPGVYAAWARPEGEEGWTEAVLNLGRAPTVGTGGDLGLEVHLLADCPDLYGVSLQVVFGEKIRDERRFPRVEELVARIRQDLAEAPRRLASLPEVRRPQALDRSIESPAPEEPGRSTG